VSDSVISYDIMKTQIDKELGNFLNSSSHLLGIELPNITFEKGTTQISFPVPPLTDSILFDFLIIIKSHLANIRITSFESGHYGIQALNTNMYNTDNLSDNIKVDFFSLVSSKAVITKKGNLSQEEINTAIELFKKTHLSAKEDPTVRLHKLGASLITDNAQLRWDYIAGYEDVKKKIKESIILPLQNLTLYDEIAHMTRKVYESNKPTAILFEGEPGVGKTTIARIIASEISIPLVYVPIESIMSKWYGQSAQNLADIFNACEDLGGAIIFLDEIDSLAGSRNQNMFEATRRVLSVLLRKLDGIDAAKNTITIGATNRKNDLDHALISRFDQTIYFPLPGPSERAAIFNNYAIHLAKEDCEILGERSQDISGRNIKDICEMTERRWARKLIIEKTAIMAPAFDYYLQTVLMWQRENIMQKN